MKGREVYALLARYLILALLVFVGYNVVYFVTSEITVYLSFLTIHLVYPNSFLLPGTSTIFINGTYIDLIEACIGVAAYYLLIFLNLTTPMGSLTRVKSLSFLLVSFLVMNIVRIFIFALVFMEGYSFFNFAHILFWYLGSTLFVAVLWFLSVIFFRIEKIPVYSDIVALLRGARGKG